MFKMTSRTLLVCCCLLAYASAANANAPQQKVLVTRPQNEAIEFGPGVVLECTALGPGEQVEWREYITDNQNGREISINNQTLSHPNGDRYSIIHNDLGDDFVEYSLSINPTVLTDGGTYRCQDNSATSSVGYAQLVMLEGPPVCTSNIPSDGSVVEGTYYTIECTIGYRGNAAPIMTWDGPEDWRGEWRQNITTTPTSVWSGVSMNMSRFFDLLTFSVYANFTERGFLGPSAASNIPTWNFTFTSPELLVHWKPGNLFIMPSDRFTFEIGETIECSSSGYPDPTYSWRNGITNENIQGALLLLRADNVGLTTFYCTASNAYGSEVLAVAITVNAVTTPTTPSTTITTTTPPAEGSCADLTGRWGATSPSRVDLCLEVDSDSQGQIIGLFRNATDPYFIEVRGRMQPDKTDEVAFVGIWPVNIGTQAFVGVCTSCMGEDTLQITAVGRVIGDFNDCSDFGRLREFSFYKFSRTGGPCRNLFKEYGIKL